MSDFVIRRRRSRYTGPVDPCLGYHVENEPSHEERFVPSSVPVEIELELDLRSSQPPDANMDLEKDEHSQQQQETGSIIDADWSVLASYKPSTTKQHRGHLGHTDHEPDLLASDHLTVDAFLKQHAKINLKNINKHGKLNHKASSDGRRGPRRRYCTLRQVRDSSNSPSARVKIMPLGEPELSLPRSNLQADNASPDGSSSEFDRDPPSMNATSPLLPSSADSYHAEPAGRPRNRARKKRKPLRVRLYEAAISTHVNPEAAFAQAPDGPEAHSRLPLRFLPEPDAPTDVEVTRPKKMSLIDPRKSRAIEDARFPAMLRPRIKTGLGAAGFCNTLDRLPIDSWSWAPNSRMHSRTLTSSTSRRRKAPATAQNVASEDPPRPTCAPLTFVTVGEADLQLQRRKTVQHRRLTAQEQLHKQGASQGGLKMVPIAARALKTQEQKDQNQILNLQPIQLPLAKKEVHSAVDSPAVVKPQRNVESLLHVNSSPPSASHQSARGHDKNEPHTPTDVWTRPGFCLTKRNTPPVSQSSGLLRSSKKRKTSSGFMLETTPTPAPASLSTSRPNTESKQLKPLAAFMGQFLENLRSVSVHIDPHASQKSTKITGRPVSGKQKGFALPRISGATTFLVFALILLLGLCIVEHALFYRYYTGSSTGIFRDYETRAALGGNSGGLVAASKAVNNPGDETKEQAQQLLPTENTLEHLNSEPSESRNNFERAGPDLSTLFEREQEYHVLLSSPSS